MDQGLAAVISAGITGVVAIAAVAGTVATARTSAKALRQQVLDQASMEHAHWLRERKATACASLIEGCWKANNIMLDWHIKVVNDPVPQWSEEQRTSFDGTGPIVSRYLERTREEVGVYTSFEKVRSDRAQLSLADAVLTEALDAVIAVLERTLECYESELQYNVRHRGGMFLANYTPGNPDALVSLSQEFIRTIQHFEGLARNVLTAEAPPRGRQADL